MLLFVGVGRKYDRTGPDRQLAGDDADLIVLADVRRAVEDGDAAGDAAGPRIGAVGGKRLHRELVAAEQLAVGERPGGGDVRRAVIFFFRIGDRNGNGLLCAARRNADRAVDHGDLILVRDLVPFLVGDREDGAGRAFAGKRLLSGVDDGGDRVTLGKGAVADRVVGRRIGAALVFAADVGDGKGNGASGVIRLPLRFERGGAGERKGIAALHQGARAGGQDELPAGELLAERVGGLGRFRIQVGDAAGDGRHTALDREGGGVVAGDERRAVERGGKLAGRVAERDLFAGRGGIECDAQNVAFGAAVEDRTDGGCVIVLGEDRGGERDGAAAVHGGPGQLEQAETALLRRGALRNEQSGCGVVARGRRDLHAAAPQVGDRGGRDRLALVVLAPVEGKAV